MTRSGKTPKTGDAEAWDFSFETKKQLRAQSRELVLTDSKTLQYQFDRLKGRIDWDALRNAATEGEVNAALSGLDQRNRDTLPNSAAIVATVKDPKYPKLRPIRFLAESCAVAWRTNPKSSDLYSPRYSRDICYKERKRRGPEPKPITDLDYWRSQDEAGMRVPVKYLRRINKEKAKKQRISGNHRLTYVDIPKTIDSVKKRRTTVWLPEATIAKLKRLSATTGAPIAELFRRAVEAYLKDN